MNTEYEVRILEVNVDDVRQKLEELKAKFEWDYIQRRYVYDFIPKQDNKWIRLRTNGEKTTNRRIQYTLNGVEVDIDSWPMIPTYLEIEGKSEEDVYKILELLGYKREDCTTRDVEGIYLDYGYDLNTIYDLKLEEEKK